MTNWHTAEQVPAVPQQLQIPVKPNASGAVLYSSLRIVVALLVARLGFSETRRILKIASRCSKESDVASYDKIVQSVAENLTGDERLRSNLTDEEAAIVLDWVLGRISAQVQGARDETNARQLVQNELAHVRPVLLAINVLAEKPSTPRLADAITAVEASLSAGKPLTRPEIFALLTIIIDRIWQVRSQTPTKHTDQGANK